MTIEELKIPLLISSILVFIWTFYLYIIRRWRNNQNQIKYPYLMDLGNGVIKGRTNIGVDLPNNEEIDLHILNLAEKELAPIFKGMQLSGTHTFNWDSSVLENGEYFCALKSKNQYTLKKFRIEN